VESVRHLSSISPSSAADINSKTDSIWAGVGFSLLPNYENLDGATRRPTKFYGSSHACRVDSLGALGFGRDAEPAGLLCPAEEDIRVAVLAAAALGLCAGEQGSEYGGGRASPGMALPTAATTTKRALPLPAATAQHCNNRLPTIATASWNKTTVSAEIPSQALQCALNGRCFWRPQQSTIGTDFNHHSATARVAAGMHQSTRSLPRSCGDDVLSIMTFRRPSSSRFSPSPGPNMLQRASYS
jgi:hypothetical protein